MNHTNLIRIIYKSLGLDMGEVMIFNGNRFFYLLLFFCIIISCTTEKCPISSEKEPNYILKTRLNEFEYIQDQFFLVDFYYQSVFESSFDPSTMRWIIQDHGKRIIQLDVWKTARHTSASSRLAWAVLDPTQVHPDSINFLQPIRGQNIQGFFRRLNEEEYFYDEYRGYFWLEQSVNNMDVVAIAYSNSSGEKFGMLWNEITDTTDIVLLKLIKAEAMQPQLPTWKLMMQNVYNMGADYINRIGFDVKVIYSITGEDILMQPVGDKKTFNYLLGLDRLNEIGEPLEGGDGITDENFLIMDYYNGYILFPSLRPFDPKYCTQFKIDSSLSVEIYDIRSKALELERHKFDIEISILDTVSHL